MAASIFISYAHEDRPRAEQLAARFVSAGWSVWWDRQIVGGARFDKATEKAIAAAKIVVALWSRASVGSAWVRAEAAWALDKDKLLPVKIDDVDLPLQFFHVPTIDLAGLDIATDAPPLLRLFFEVDRRIRGMYAPIFISYAHEDRARAEQLAARFGIAGWPVWWDRHILGGPH